MVCSFCVKGFGLGVHPLALDDGFNVTCWCCGVQHGGIWEYPRVVARVSGVIGVLAGGLLATLGRMRGGWGRLLRRLVCRWAGWLQHTVRTLLVLEDGGG